MSRIQVRAERSIDQFWRFVATGLLNTAAHTIIAIAMIEVGGVTLIVANMTAFIAATLLSYLVNTLWSFSGTINTTTLFRFFVVSVVGLLLAGLVSSVAQASHVHYLVGIACVPVFVTPVTFTLHRIWTYRRAA